MRTAWVSWADCECFEDWTRCYLLACYGVMGKKAEAEWEISEIEALGQPISIQAFMKSTTIRDPDYRKIYEDALRKAGLPER